MVYWNRIRYWKRANTRTALLFAATLAAAAALAWSRGGGEPDALRRAPKLEVLASAELPITEVSGLALRTGEDGAPQLVAVGDHDARLAVARVDTLAPKPTVEPIGTLDFTAVVAQRFSPCALDAPSKPCARELKSVTSQWEAVSVDGEDNVYLLQEHTRAVVALSPDLTRVRGVVNFALDGAGLPLGKPRRGKHREDARSGEGMVLLKGGHILIAKEKSPALFVEVGPRGDAPLGLSAATLLAPGEAFAWPKDEHVTFEALHAWRLADAPRCDMSELAVSATGELYVMSQTCNALWKVQGLALGDETVHAAQAWRLPKRARGAEGLAVLPSGEMVVAVDRKGGGRNAYLLAPPGAVRYTLK